MKAAVVSDCQPPPRELTRLLIVTDMGSGCRTDRPGPPAMARFRIASSGSSGGETKSQEYRKKLRTLKNWDWDSFLLQESGLPGPRGNLELVQAVADEGDWKLFERFVRIGPKQAPTNSPGEFLAVCGAVGLGRLVAEGHTQYLATLRACASDPRWRMREGVAMALQRIGDANMPLLLKEAKKWSRGALYEKRAAAAGLCEPRLLKDPKDAKKVLAILDAITASVPRIEERKGEELAALKKGLGYCWSVATVALPDEGKPMMEKWFASQDRDVRWIMKENLRKDRLVRMDARWVERWRRKIAK